MRYVSFLMLFMRWFVYSFLRLSADCIVGGTVIAIQIDAGRLFDQCRHLMQEWLKCVQVYSLSIEQGNFFFCLYSPLIFRRTRIEWSLTARQATCKQLVRLPSTLHSYQLPCTLNNDGGMSNLYCSYLLVSSSVFLLLFLCLSYLYLLSVAFVYHFHCLGYLHFDWTISLLHSFDK
jgi:hypothetical protein